MLPCAWALLLAGCQVTGGGDTSTSMGTAETGDGNATEGETGEPWEPILARGDIELTQVVVNQGVDVPIGNLGVWVGPLDRNTYVVSGRDTLLRGYWTIPEDWAPRNITAVLDLRYPDGTEVQKTDTKMIDGPSFAGDFNRGFLFQLLADEFPPGVQYHLALWEAGPGAEEQRESTTVIESPLDGYQLIGAEEQPAELKVVVMPVQYDDGAGCSTNTGEELTAEQEQRFIDYLHEQYPVQKVTFEFRRDTPIVRDTELTSLAQLWAPLQEQRANENADPNVYFYALVNACTGGIDGAGGIATGLPPATKAVALERVASGLWISNNEEFGYNTIVHELGHLHGRAHVFCAGGDAAGVDPSYPYEDGIIGVWGFGIRLFQLHSPTATRDFMTYCMPTWVSDWGWAKAFDRIRTLTAWDYEAPGEPEPMGEMMYGLLLKDGTEEWWTVPGWREPEHFSSGEFIEFDYGDEVIPSPTAVRTLEDGTIMITTMVPRPNATFETATRVAAAGQTREIAVAKRIAAKP
jgi:hypothetical protein